MIEELDSSDEEPRDVERQRSETAQRRKQAWEYLHVGIVVETIDRSEVEQEQLEGVLSALQKQDFVGKSQNRVEWQGECPICGINHVDYVPEFNFPDDIERPEEASLRRISDCRDGIRRPSDAPRPEVSRINASNR